MTRAENVFKLSNETARRLLIDTYGLGPARAGKLDAHGLYERIKALGYVQLDSIRTVERAHHHILFARDRTYRPKLLDRLTETGEEPRLFEHWTHDAALIPLEWYGHWSHRFERFKQRIEASPRWRERLGPAHVIDTVRKRIEEEGPLEASAFAGESGRTGPWWGWSQHKSALEYLWFTGELAIAGRAGFRKVYDLAERVIPECHRGKASAKAAHIDWACRSALERLGFADVGQIADFWDAVTRKEVETWCRHERAKGSLIEVDIDPADGGPARRAFTPADIETRIGALSDAPGSLRLLNPFDPLIRDRKRLERIFGFHYRIEIFVPAAKRQYGYYVFPMLEGARFVGRTEVKADRKADRLDVLGLWLEPGVKWSKGRRAKYFSELERCARLAGVSQIEFPKSLEPK